MIIWVLQTCQRWERDSTIQLESLGELLTGLAPSSFIDLPLTSLLLVEFHGSRWVGLVGLWTITFRIFLNK